MKELLTWLSVLIMATILILSALLIGWLMIPCLLIGMAIKWVIDKPLTRRIK